MKVWKYLIAAIALGAAAYFFFRPRPLVVEYIDSFMPQKGLHAYIWRTVGDGDKRWVSTGLFYGVGRPHWYVRGSLDGGQTWQTWDDSSEPSTPGSEALGATFAKDGSIYVNGTGGHDQTEILRRSTDQGKTWKVLHVGSDILGGAVSLGDNMFTDSQGQVFELGSSVDVASNQHWWVRKLLEAPDQWEMVDNLMGGKVNENGNADPQSMIEDSRHRYYVTGWWSSPVNDFSLLTTQMSRDGGKNWYISDTFALEPNKNSRGRGIFITPDDHLFVVGHSSGDCIVRKSVDAGQNWATSDHYRPPGSKECIYLHGVAVDGELFVAGRTVMDNGVQHAILRRSRDDGRSWSTVFESAGRTGDGAFFNSIGVDSEKNLIVGGTEAIKGEGEKWTMLRVRR